MSDLYLARRKLKITQVPGTVPSTITVEPGQRFELDGDEPINVSRLLNSGAIEPYVEQPEQDQYIEEQAKARAKQDAKPQLRRRRSGTNTRKSS